MAILKSKWFWIVAIPIALFLFLYISGILSTSPYKQEAAKLKQEMEKMKVEAKEREAEYKTSVDSLSKLSVEAEKRLSDLKKRNNVLIAQNAETQKMSAARRLPETYKKSQFLKNAFAISKSNSPLSENQMQTYLNKTITYHNK